MARNGGTGSAADFVSDRLTLPALREAAAGCRDCHLWQVGTQTVFGLRGEPADRDANFAAFVDDLKLMASLLLRGES